MRLEVEGARVDGARRTRANWGLVIGGIVTFGATYLVNIPVSVALGTSHSDHETLGYMYSSLIPLVGPWLQLGLSTNSAQVPVAMVAAVARATGLVMFVVGLTAARSPVPEVRLGARGRVTFTPTISGNSAGLMAMGSF